MDTNGNVAHKKFVNKIIDFNKYMPTDAPAMTKEQRKRVVKEWSDSIQQNKIRKREIAKKRQLKKAKAAKRKFVGRIAAFALAGVAAFSVGKVAYNAYTENQHQNSPITVEQALEHGETLETLGIDSSIPIELQDIEQILENENITNQEIIALAPRINSVYFDTVKGKLANTLGTEKENIKIYTEPAEEGTTRESVKVKNGDTFMNRDFFRNENSISTEISDSIKNISKMQKIMEEIQQGTFNRNDIIGKYKDIVNGVSQIAATKFEVDKKGNISADVTKVKDLNNKINNASIDEEPEL